jgi:hypothetical protein
MKPRRMRWEGTLARMREKKIILVVKPEERYHLESVDVNGRIMLKLLFE